MSVLILGDRVNPCTTGPVRGQLSPTLNFEAAVGILLWEKDAAKVSAIEISPRE